MAGLFKKLSETQLARDVAQQVARLVIDGSRRGRRLSIGICMIFGMSSRAYDFG